MTGWSSASTEADARAEIARLRHLLETGSRLMYVLVRRCVRAEDTHTSTTAREVLTADEWVDAATHRVFDDDAELARLRTEVEACERALAERSGR